MVPPPNSEGWLAAIPRLPIPPVAPMLVPLVPMLLPVV